MTGPEPFGYVAEVAPGQKRNVRSESSETYLGDPVEIPVTISNGGADGTPTVTVETGEAHRFQRPHIDKAREGVEGVLAE